jgi:hypothetical protein
MRDRSTALSRRALLGTAVAAGLVPLGAGLSWRNPSAAASPSPRRRLIVVWAQGGWDVTYVFDPKLGVAGIEGPEHFAGPGGADEVRRFGELEVVTNGVARPAVGAFFEAHHPRTAVINGIWVGSIAHDPCRVRMLTGTTAQTSADVATITGAAYGATLPLGSIDLSGVGFTGPLASTAGSIGASSQIKTLLEPERAFAAPPGALPYPRFQPTEGDEALIQARQLARFEALRERLPDAPRLLDFEPSLARAQRLSTEATSVVHQLELGVRAPFPVMLDLATDLLAQDVCAAVLVDTQQRWDTHANNQSQGAYFQSLFSSLNALARHLDDKGLAQTTTVAVLSEMTRTPKHNFEQGKDHWQHTSAMLFGANVRSGQYGATDDLLESLPMDLATGEPTPLGALCQYPNFAAGLLALLDVDPGAHLPGVTPFRGAILG